MGSVRNASLYHAEPETTHLLLINGGQETLSVLGRGGNHSELPPAACHVELTGIPMGLAYEYNSSLPSTEHSGGNHYFP